MSTDTILKIRAAMFAAIPSGLTKFSRNGYSIVFARPVCGRHDLSDLRDEFALAQAQDAGLDLDAVTLEQIQAYQAWHDAMHEERRIGQARILITRPYSAERNGELVQTNRVALIDGWGDVVEEHEIVASEYYDTEAINKIGGKGAFCRRPNIAVIERAIAALRSLHPEFAEARVQNNNDKK